MPVLMLRGPAVVCGSKFYKHWIDFEISEVIEISSIITRMSQEAK
jgi:hypothetical protein